MFTKPLTIVPRYILIKFFFLAIGWSYLHDLSHTFLKKLKLLWGTPSRGYIFCWVSCRTKSSLSEITCQTCFASTDNSRTSRLSIFYSISNHKNFIPKCLDNVLADFAQTMYSVYSSLRLRANRRNNFQHCCANSVGSCWLKSLTSFKLCATTRKNIQQLATGCVNGRNM